MTEITSEITPEVLIFYYNLIDDVLWEFSSKEVREDVKDLYNEIKKVADNGYQRILAGNLSDAAIYLEGAKDCFNALQEIHGSPDNIDKKILK
jgi:hypothetical protein